MKQQETLARKWQIEVANSFDITLLGQVYAYLSQEWAQTGG